MKNEYFEGGGSDLSQGNDPRYAWKELCKSSTRIVERGTVCPKYKSGALSLQNLVGRLRRRHDYNIKKKFRESTVQI